jgi:hypothetical protein
MNLWDGLLENMFGELFLSQVYAVHKLPDRPYIIDCGGNIGLSVIWFKQRYPQARITVFEADPTQRAPLGVDLDRSGENSSQWHCWSYQVRS